MSDETRSKEWLLGAYNACAALTASPTIRGSALQVVRSEGLRYLHELSENYGDTMPKLDVDLVENWQNLSIQEQLEHLTPHG